jgi:glutamate racemase
MIGIFDSGMGGLTVLKAIKEEMPSIDVLYFGDTKNAPYGLRPREELSALTIKAIQLLRSRGSRSIVSACNTVSASMTVSLFDTFSLASQDRAPEYLIEMVGPTVAYFRNSTARLLLCATPATIESRMYQNAFEMIGKNVDAFPISELAGAIEEGKGTKEDKSEIERIIRNALQNISLENYDVLILACTHYPLVQELFQEIVGSSVLVFDPAVAVAERVKKQLWPREMADGKITFLVSRDSTPFRTFAARLFPGSAYSIEVVS